MTAEELSRKVRGLELRARKMTGGLISGAYHSAFKGRGIEFLDVREYVPGDDTRKLAKGMDCGADALILDLEDAVAPSRKALARTSSSACAVTKITGTALFMARSLA